MAKKAISTDKATNYVSRIKLGFSAKDLKDNAALARKVLIDLKDAKADGIALRDSLKATQDFMESSSTTYTTEIEKLKIRNHTLDRDNAVLRAAARNRLGVTIIQDLTSAGIGGGIGAFIAGQSLIGVAVTLPCLIVFIICRVINSR